MSPKKPYYLRQPWDVLFKESKLEKVSPWSIDLVQLLATLLVEMEQEGIDFRVAGTAINSSVLIYLKKAEMLLQMEEFEEAPAEKPQFYLPPAVPLPFRFEHTTTTVTDLINALEKALEDSGRPPSPKLPVLEMVIPDFLDVDQYLLEVEARAEDLLERIQRRDPSRGVLTLRELASGLDWLEVVRIFMMLLFLAQHMEVNLEQNEEETDISVTVVEASD